MSGPFQPPGDAPLLMGIVNVTPDSFSDGGRYADAGRAAEHALRLASDGASILDIGGESTRPGADPVDAGEELRRILPVVEQLAEQTDTPISIDTTKASVARAALEAGASIVNDVSGLEADPAMVGLVAEAQCGVIAMHMRGDPRTMQNDPRYDDVVAEVKDHLAERRDALLAAGVSPDRLCLDPGIGFGKTSEHNWRLLRSLDALQQLGCTLMVGHSRKRFLGELLGDPNADRTAATVGVALACATRRVQVIRVHDVRPVADALAAFSAAGGFVPKKSRET